MRRGEEIMHRVARATGVTVAELRSRAKHKTLAEARQLAMLLMRDVEGMSLPEIGRMLDRDHTTVMHGIRSAKENLEFDRGDWRHYLRAVHGAYLRKPVAYSPCATLVDQCVALP